MLKLQGVFDVRYIYVNELIPRESGSNDNDLVYFIRIAFFTS